MILITGTELRSDLELLSGVLLDAITEADFRKDVFTAFLVSDRIREVICELPVYAGGMGSTSEGLLVSEFETKLFGVRQHAYARGSNSTESVVRSTIENRIALVTTSDIRGVLYPAFLSPERPHPPARTGAVVTLEIEKVADLPEMRAFAVLEPEIIKSRDCQEAVKTGTILPVTVVSDRRKLVAALELIEQTGHNEFKAVIHHEADSEMPCKGDVLERKLTLRNTGSTRRLAGQGETMEFNARIGIIVYVN